MERLTKEQTAQLQAQLQQAIVACNERCLYFAAKWTAELLNSFDDDDSQRDTSDTEVDEDYATPTLPTNHDRKEARLEAKELPRYLMAKSFFDCREFDRCAAVFLPSHVPHTTPSHDVLSPTKIQPATPGIKHARQVSSAAEKTIQRPPPPLPQNLSQKSLFLGLYARYLSGEKRKNEDSEAILGPHDGPATANKEVTGIATILEEYFNAHGGLDNFGNSQGWLEYLYGIILIKSKSEPLATQWLIRSVNINPFNWSAWLELASLTDSAEELEQISYHLPRNIMTFLFHIHCSQELGRNDPSIHKNIAGMLKIFPRSAFLLQQKALISYHIKDYQQAMIHFDDLIRANPHRLDAMEIYSNTLYCLENRPKLATLAAMASDTDKFRPETNCILGNYYSLVAEHEKAVLHFRRALMLDRNFQAAWTLTGHEYIELKNTQAAIESYRRAVDINRKDFRAWYGLGQGYEMLECHSYSLFYYQRAASLHGLDPKMWCAVGNAFSKCGKTKNAIQAFKRALIVGMDNSTSFSSSDSSDPLAHAVGGALDPQVLYEIALLYEKDSEFEEAAAYMELTLAQEEGPEEGDEGLGVTHITSRARLWLARYSYSIQDWQRTMDLANELTQDGVEVEEAKSLVRDVRARMHMQEVEGDED